MKHKTRSCLTLAEGIAIIESFYKSGLKQKEFCERHRIAYHIIQYWKPIYKQYAQTTVQPCTFLPITVVDPAPAKPNATTPIKIVFHARGAIEIGPDADWVVLKKVLEVCLSCG